jgi:hypothetical protein
MKTTQSIFQTNTATAASASASRNATAISFEQAHFHQLPLRFYTLLLAFALALIFHPLHSFAAEKKFEVKMDVAINGKTVSTPRLNLKEGEKATVRQNSFGEKTFIEVMATEQVARNGSSSILLDFVVGKYNSDGTKTTISEPQLLTLPNEEAQVVVEKPSGKNDFSFKVTANKAKL